MAKKLFLRYYKVRYYKIIFLQKIIKKKSVKSKKQGRRKKCSCKKIFVHVSNFKSRAEQNSCNNGARMEILLSETL